MDNIGLRFNFNVPITSILVIDFAQFTNKAYESNKSSVRKL